MWLCRIINNVPWSIYGRFLNLTLLSFFLNQGLCLCTLPSAYTWSSLTEYFLFLWMSSKVLKETKMSRFPVWSWVIAGLYYIVMCYGWPFLNILCSSALKQNLLIWENFKRLNPILVKKLLLLCPFPLFIYVSEVMRCGGTWRR